MFGKTGKTVLLMLLISVVIARFAAPALTFGGTTHEDNAVMTAQIQALIPASAAMVDGAIAVLSDGWSAMGPNQREAFLNLYDPSNTAEIDDRFVQTVHANFREIRDQLDGDLKVKYEPEHEKCLGQRLYFTDVITLHVCPYFLVEQDEIRKARTLIHELTHIALLVGDRPYYRPTSKAYAELTPTGPWTSRLPIVGPLIREIVAVDTLYHPDAYAHFALAMSGRPGALEEYLDRANPSVNASYQDAVLEASDSEDVTDSWARQ